MIQLLVHGGTCTGCCWKFPDSSGGIDRFNDAAGANEAGFATLAIDWIGSGGSSPPAVNEDHYREQYLHGARPLTSQGVCEVV